MVAIDIKDLKKTYKGGIDALKGIDLTINKGDFFGLLGPNGAGKTTTIGILSGLTNKTSGVIHIQGHNFDHDPFFVRQFLGVVPQEFNFNVFEPCIQIVVNQAGYYGISKHDAEKKALELFNNLGLWDKRFTPSGQLSGGMKRRLMIARGLVHQPKILILDEPTAGVDISLRRSMWTFLEKLVDSGITIILTTHYLEEAEALCNKIAIIDKGRIVENTDKSTLLDKLHQETYVLFCDPFDTVPNSFYPLRKIDSQTLEVDVKGSELITDVVSHLSEHHIHIRRIQNKANRLEELFLKLTE